MIYTSAKGTKITIPDGLTPAQITAIKKDADAGYGTRAQQTANQLGAALTSQTDTAFTTEGKTPAELQDMLARTQAEIDKRGGVDKAPNYAARLTQIQQAITASSGITPPPVTGPAPGTQPDASGYMPGAEPKPAYPDTKIADPGGSLTNESVTPKTGINQEVASNDISKSETNDLNTNFQLEHPQLITDANGNTREITRHADGTVTVKDTAGGTAQTFRDLATAAAQSFNGAADRTRAENATYGTLTQYYDRDMSREREQAQQEMANRGIPYDPAAEQDPNTKNLYGKTLGAIGQKYQGLKDTASQQAVISGNQAYATDSAARDSFLSSVVNGYNTFGGSFGQYQNNTTTNQADNDAEILGMTVQDYATRYGLTLQDAQIKRDDATKRLAIAKSGSGGGGSSSGTSSSTSGGGFDVQF